MTQSNFNERHVLEAVRVILLEELQPLGTVGDEVKVRAAFARDYLLPKMKALQANDANRRAFEVNRDRLAEVPVSLGYVTGKVTSIGRARSAGGAPGARTQTPSEGTAAPVPWPDATDGPLPDDAGGDPVPEGFESRDAAAAALRAEFEALLGDSPEQRLDRLGDMLGEARDAMHRPLVLGGSGLGPLVSTEAGGAAIDAIAVDDLTTDWAQSRLLGAAEMASRLEVSPATLANWRQEGTVIAFKRDRRNYSYPLRQVHRGTPIPGLSGIVAHFDRSDEAWEWLVTPNVHTGGLPPIDRLRLGKVGEVERAAEGAADFA